MPARPAKQPRPRTTVAKVARNAKATRALKWHAKVARNIEVGPITKDKEFIILGLKEKDILLTDVKAAKLLDHTHEEKDHDKDRKLLEDVRGLRAKLKHDMETLEGKGL